MLPFNDIEVAWESTADEDGTAETDVNETGAICVLLDGGVGMKGLPEPIKLKVAACGTAEELSSSPFWTAFLVSAVAPAANENNDEPDGFIAGNPVKPLKAPDGEES